MAALSPNVLPPVSRIACARSVTVPGRSPSVLIVPGAPPRTSTPAAAPSGTSTTVHPVWPCASVQCPTDTPAGSRALISLPPSRDVVPEARRLALCGVRPGGCGVTLPVADKSVSLPPSPQMADRPGLENRQVAVQFERGDLMTVVPPFFPLVAKEEV